ncbi:winged helix family two component transcriptional regulator [Novosphingobium sp. PhB165]|uniref:response regulator n=1 Tax=Novosphingobium sp. PhB165 TaxID=2485105 RepID=UPI0010461884|nr:response regulator [Novosphingobium sp. PhB165]TCM22107.1 winged helix family two component transcriptional regulator [Novosphingobium sp. PhB165]
MRLLVVEDNPDLANAIAQAFAAHDIRCDWAATAGDAELLVETTDYSALILDLGLPDEDGLSLLKRLRNARITVPVIVVTARGESEMRIKGLDNGADDYVVKPFLFAELHARLNAILRRQSGYVDTLLRTANLTLDQRSREVTIDGKPFELSTREIEVLELLMRRSGHVVPKQVLEDQLFGAGDTLGSNAVEVYVHRLRRKLEELAAVKVQTVRGIGYMLSAA